MLPCHSGHQNVIKTNTADLWCTYLHIRKTLNIVALKVSLTVIAVVVHQDDFFEQVSRRVIDSRVDRAQDHRQSLVDKDEDEGDLGEVSRVADLSASARGDTRKHTICKIKPFHACHHVKPAAFWALHAPLILHHCCKKTKLPQWSCPTSCSTRLKGEPRAASCSTDQIGLFIVCLLQTGGLFLYCCFV